MENNGNNNNNGNDDKAGLNVPETLKKLFTAGVSAAFMTEDAIRSFVGDMKLPKETINLILQGASKSKEELMSRVSGEITKVISKTDFAKLLVKILETHRMRISADIEFIKKDGEATSKSKSTESEDGDDF